MWAETICCSVAQLCPTICNRMDCGTPGFPVLHHLLELDQTRVHWVGDAIQASHPLSSPSPPAFNLSQNQGLFQWEGSSHQCGQSIGVSVSASDLSVNIQGWFPLLLTGLISLQSKGVVKSPLQYHSPQASILRHSVFFFLLSSCHICTWLLEKP